MKDLETGLRSLGEAFNGKVEPISSLRARSRRRRRRRRLGWSAGAVVAVAAAAAAAWPAGPESKAVKVDNPVSVTPSTEPAPRPVPADPSGHFRAGWLPPGLWFDHDQTTQGGTVVSYSAPPAFSDATTVDRPTFPESITITAGRLLAPPGSAPAGEVQGHPAVSIQLTPGDVGFMWSVRPGLTIQMIGHLVSMSDLRRVADGLYELPAGSPDLAPSPRTELLGVPEPDGSKASLAVTEKGTTLCVRLQLSNGSATGPCGDDPARDPIGIGVTLNARYTLFGIAPPEAATVQVLLSSGQTLAASAVPSPTITEARFWAVAIPGVQPVAAVTAFDHGHHRLATRDILVGAPGDAPPPWTAPPLSAGQAPAAITKAWRADQDRSGCVPVGFAATEVPGATAQIAPFGGTGWGVGFDKAGLPGRDTSGHFAPTGGHSVFGVSCSQPDIVDRIAGMPHHIIWSDGSRADYGPEGFTGPDWIANIHIKGQTNLYEVWSALGQHHLEYLLSQLRYIDTNK